MAAFPNMTPWTAFHCLVVGAAALLPIACSQPVEPTPSEPADSARSAASVPLRVLVVNDPALAVVVERQWRSRAEGQIAVRQMEVGQLLEAERIAADAVIYPSGLIGELAERSLIAPVARDVLSQPQLARSDIFDLQRLHETMWGETTYAVPFGSPQLTLYYRTDLFERLGLKPPESWGEYQEAVRRLSDRDELGDLAPPADAVWRPAAEPLGPQWAGQVLLARAAAYSRQRSQYSTLFNFTTMAPLIGGPPFVRALEELVAAAGGGPAEKEALLHFTPRDVEREFLQGRCAMTLAWPTAARTGEETPEAPSPPALGLVELPGSPDVYNIHDQRWEQRQEDEVGRVSLLAIAGRLGSVSRVSRRPRQALELLVWLSGKDWGGDVAPHSPDTTLYRRTQMADPSRWVGPEFPPDAARRYAEVVSQAQSRQQWFASVRIPGRAAYLDALDHAVQTAVRGESSPADALRQAARQWRSITQERGLERQQQAYLRSLGLEP